MKTVKRIMSIVLSGMLAVSCVPMSQISVSAATDSLTVTVDTGVEVTIKDTDGDGFYEIGDADELYAFAALSNKNYTLNAMLIEDIVVNEGKTPSTARLWTPIGAQSDYSYKGVFDGNNKQISGLFFDNSTANNVGLFGITDDNSEVKNVIVVSSYLKGADGVGGIAGRSNGDLSNCYFSGTVIGGDYVGGIVGEATQGTIANCYNIGRVNGNDYVGGMVGYNNSDSKLENCYNIGNVSSNNTVGGIVALNDGVVNNCYYLEMICAGGINGKDVAGSAEAKTFDQFRSGEVAYLLQGTQEAGVWGQKLGTDDYPVLGGDKVYQIENCKNEIIYYSNTDENIDHKWENSVCTVCSKSCEHKWEEATCTVCDKVCSHDEYVNGFCTVCDSFEPATLITDKYGNKDCEIANAGQLYWFAHMVNTDQIGSVDVVLTADIEVNEGYTFGTDGTVTKDGKTVTEGFRTWTNIGDDSGGRAFYGRFDGQNHTISGLYCTESGSFIYWNDGEIKNLGIINSYFYDNIRVGGIANINYGTIYNCYNAGILSSEYRIGGIAGESCGNIYNCYNTGAIILTRTKYSSAEYECGGIVASSSGYIGRCYNTGTISFTAEKYSQEANIGGIVGVNDGTVDKCYNTGAIRVKTVGFMHVGGIAGENWDTIKYCYNIGILGDKDGGNFNGLQQLGGIAARDLGTTVNDCYYLNRCFTGSFYFVKIDGTEAKTAEQFANGEVAYLLGWGFGQKIGEDAHPVLNGDKVYKVNNCKNEPAYSNTNHKLDHKWENATCTTPKTCLVCGETYGKPLDHEYENGACTNCGELKPVDEHAGYTVSLGDKVGANYYMTLTEETLKDTNAKMIFTVSDTGSSYTVEVPVSEAVKNGDHYVFTCEIAAKEMASVIKAKFVTSDSETALEDYSVQQYAEIILSDTTNYANEQALVKAMLNYGAYAQVYFNHNTDNLANSILDEADKALVDTLNLSAYASSTSGEQEGVKFYGGLLSLKSETAIKLYFKADSDINALGVTVNGEKTEAVKNDKYYEVKISDIPAHKLNDTFEVKVGELTVKYGAFSYGNTAMNTDKDTLKNVVKAMYAYNVAALNYGGNK